MTKYRIVIAATAFLVAIVGTVLVLKVVNNNQTSTNQDSAQTKTEKIKSDADSLKAQAIKSINDRDYAEAITLLESAKTKFTEIKDTDNIVDTESLIHLSENNRTPPPAAESVFPVSGQ